MLRENACVSGRLYEDYFDLQLRVATAYARLGGLTRSTAIARFTNLRRRFGLVGDSGASQWEGFLHSVPEDAEHEGCSSAHWSGASVAQRPLLRRLVASVTTRPMLTASCEFISCLRNSIVWTAP